MNKYLNKDPLPWLLEKCDPHIRYLTLRDIFDVDISGDEMKNEYKLLRNIGRVQDILRTNVDGILGDMKNFDAFYRGALWYIGEMVEMGFDQREDSIKRTADSLLDNFQMSSGGITINWKPKVAVACRTGEMMRFLIKSGISDERIDKGIHWILNNQRFDGGWLHCPMQKVSDVFKFLFLNRSGKGLKVENSKNISSCIYATIACARALLMYSKRKKIDGDVISRAAEYFLKNKLFCSKNNGKYIPICCRYGKSDFRNIGYPIIFQYDILSGLQFIAESGLFNDKRTGEAFNVLVAKQNSEGRWVLENTKNGMLFGNENKKLIRMRENKWITLRVMRLFKLAGLPFR